MKTLYKPLECIFNCSWLTRVVPNKFKIASVVPIFKKGSHMIVNNYHLISLLSIFNQLLEKIVSKRLTFFINNHNILYSKQFGFRSQHSTIQAVLSIIDKIQGVENRKYSCGVFLDLSKAFDIMNHNILLQKLEHYGIRCVVLSNSSNTRQRTLPGFQVRGVRSSLRRSRGLERTPST